MVTIRMESELTMVGDLGRVLLINRTSIHRSMEQLKFDMSSAMHTMKKK